jgi:hypothetical protein
VEHAVSNAGGIGSIRQSRSGGSRGIWVRVDEAGR